MVLVMAIWILAAHGSRPGDRAGCAAVLAVLANVEPENQAIGGRVDPFMLLGGLGFVHEGLLRVHAARRKVSLHQGLSLLRQPHVWR